MKYMMTLHVIVIDSQLVAKQEPENTVLEAALIYATFMIQYYIIGQYTVDNPYLPANSAMLSPNDLVIVYGEALLKPLLTVAKATKRTVA
jgi:phage gp36-like protein